MRPFLKNIVLVLLPSVVLLSYVMVIFFSHNLHWFYTKKDFGKNFILGEPYNDEFAAYYKLHKNLDEYKILAIGSSRVLPFSEDMFEENFFNLGYLAGSVPQTQYLVEKKDIRNKTLIIAIDQWAMNPNWPFVKNKELLTGKIFETTAILGRNKLEDILVGKVYPARSSAGNINLIGSGANLAISGIMHDGSYYYGKIYQGLLTNDEKLIGRDHHFRDTKYRIIHGIMGMEYGQKADTDAIRAIRDLIITCRERNNQLVLFFPPFPPSIIPFIEGSKYSYIPDASEKISRISDSLGVRFYDFTKTSAADSEYVDGLHGGKKVYYDMLKQMNFPVRPVRFFNAFESDADTAYIRLRKRFFNR